MTVKDRVGRVRNVAFRVHGGPVPRHALGAALPPFAKLTRFDGTHGVLRIGHRDREALAAFLGGLARVGGRDVRVETLRTSGTLRKAAEALPRGSPAARRDRKKTKETKPAGPRPPAEAGRAKRPPPDA